MISLVKKYRELPRDIAEKVSEANMFWGENYYNYMNSCGAHMCYAYNAVLAVPIVIYEKIHIKYAMYACEYLEISSSVSSEEKKKFLEEVEQCLKTDEKIAWITTNAASFFDVYPQTSKRIPFGSNVIDLNVELEELWKKVHSKHRNSIRKAEKSEVYVKKGGLELLGDYLKLDEETWERSNKSSYGNDFFCKIVDNLKENVTIYIAYKDVIPQAGACYFLNQEMSYYMYGASCSRPESGATNYLHWEAIKDFKERGIKKYSFVGYRINEDEDSKYHGIQRFKERFGGELIRGYMFKTILIPWKYNLFHLIYKIKNKRELTDAIDQEIHKWQDIN